MVPDEVDVNMQLELIDFQSHNTLKSLFKNENLIKFYSLLPENNYSNIRKFARKVISIFRTVYIYICE